MRALSVGLSLALLAGPASADSLCQQLIRQGVGGSVAVRFGERCARDGNCRTSHGLDETNQLRRGHKYQIAALLPDGYSQSVVAVKIRATRTPPQSDSAGASIDAGQDRSPQTVDLKRDAIPFACGRDDKRAEYPASAPDDEIGVDVSYRGYDIYHRSGRPSRAEQLALDQFHLRYKKSSNGRECVATNSWKLRPYFLFADPQNVPGFWARLLHIDPYAGKAVADADVLLATTVSLRVRVTAYHKDAAARACVTFPVTADGDKVQIDIIDLSRALDSPDRRSLPRPVKFVVID